ncbi:response regulator [Candidatus Giovannonibacteria bacterium]|nr:response regulator [Candidatus Giovannonibacteria bacterium]
MKRILFIEDEEALQRSMEDSLKAGDYEVLKALDGEIGVETAKKQHPDLILLDLILPKKNGFEVLAELKKDASTKNIPVMVLTNLEGSQDIEKALSLGATTYLVKANYNLQDILKKIEMAINHHS